MLIRFFIALLLLNITFAEIAANEGIRIEQAWIPEAPPVASVMAGYMRITNTTDKAVTILSVKSPAFDRVEIHKTVEENNMARMIKQDSLSLPPEKQTDFSPGGLHLMLMQPKQPLVAGDSVYIELGFSDGTKLKTKFTVKKSGTNQTHDHHHHHH